MDLHYWIDYVVLFGVEDLIPLYDGVDFITYRNLDVWAIYILLGVAVAYLFGKCIKCFKK